MKFAGTPLAGLILIEPTVYRDDRGFFLETYQAQRFAENGIPETFVQDNHSKSARGTLRGLHAQITRPQGKLVRIVAGEVFDVAVDIRRGSPTFGKWFSVVLSAKNFRILYVPPGFAHGFYTLSETAEMEYKCTDLYSPNDELRLIWNDPEIKIDWPGSSPTLSAKDAAAKSLAQLEPLLPVFPSTIHK